MEGEVSILFKSPLLCIKLEFINLVCSRPEFYPVVPNIHVKAAE
jgi:hypothetical protein